MIRILTLNLNDYGSQFGNWEERKERIAKVIQQADADILAFQAVCMEQTRFGGINQAAQISLDLPKYRYALYQPAVIQENGSAEGCAVLARFPITIAGFKPLAFQPGLDDPNRRVVQYVCFDVNGAPVHLYNAHTSWVEEQARSNIEEVLEFVDRYRGLRVLVGDFNNPPESALIRQIAQQGWVDAWRRLRPHEPGYTFDSRDPRMRIDYIWVDPMYAGALKDIQVLTGSAGEAGGYLSNHFALMAAFDI